MEEAIRILMNLISIFGTAMTKMNSDAGVMIYFSP